MRRWSFAAMPYVKIGRNLRRWRKCRRLTAEELARRIDKRSGVPWTAGVVDAVERGERRLTLVDIYGLSKLGLDMEDLMAGIDIPTFAATDGDIFEHADVGIARRLTHLVGCTVAASDVVAIASAMWGWSFTDECERRLTGLAVESNPRSVQAQRGHVSRDMLSEMADFMTDREEVTMSMDPNEYEKDTGSDPDESDEQRRQREREQRELSETDDESDDQPV